MVAQGTVRQSGKTTAEETVIEASKDAENPLDIPVDQKRRFRTPGFSRMRTEWRPEDSILITRAKAAADERLMKDFRDAYQILAHIYDLVRKPKVDRFGKVMKDDHGWIIWDTDEYGMFIEDWSQLNARERDNILFAISTRLFDWEQRNADANGEALFAKGQWEERKAIGFDAPMSGTVQDRDAAGIIDSAEERYFAIHLTIYSRKTEALVKTFQRIADVLQKSMIAGR